MIWAFVLKHWTWAAMGLLGAGVLYFSQMDAQHSADLKTSRVEAASQKGRADAAEQAFRKAQELAGETAQAHAREIHDVAAVHNAAATAKQGAAHAPGSDDRFTYSDDAYGFMRGAQPAPAAPVAGSAEAPSGVDL